MSPEEQPPMEQVDALNECVDALLAHEKPSPARGLSGEAAEALRMAAFLSSAASHQAPPSAAFLERLRGRLTGPRKLGFDFRLSRRGLARGLVGGAAALAACLVGGQALQRFAERKVPAGWVPIARAAELPPGTVKRFVAGDMDGHVMNIGGRIWALSAVCTHQACLLSWRGEQQEFVCGCHGAEFDTGGRQVSLDDYDLPLPPLAKIPIQQLDGTIYVVAA